MNGPVAIAGPFAIAALGVTVRHRAGAWASWLLVLGITFLECRYLASPPWWTSPDFLSGLDEAVGLAAGGLLMALCIHEFEPGRPAWPLQVTGAAALGLLGAWANAHVRPSTTQVTMFLTVCGAWLLALLVRKRRRQPARE